MRWAAGLAQWSWDLSIYAFMPGFQLAINESVDEDILRILFCWGSKSSSKENTTSQHNFCKATKTVGISDFPTALNEGAVIGFAELLEDTIYLDYTPLDLVNRARIVEQGLRATRDVNLFCSVDAAPSLTCRYGPPHHGPAPLSLKMENHAFTMLIPERILQNQETF